MASVTFTGSKGHHTFTVTLTSVSTIPPYANTAYAYVTMTMYGGSYDFSYSTKSISWSLNVGGYMFSGSFGTYTADSTLTLINKEYVTIDVSGGDTSVTLNVTDGIGASYTTGDISSTKELPDFTTYYFTSVGKPGAPILTQNADGSILVQCTIGSAGTNNSATDVHVYYRWGNSTVSSTSGQYSGSLNLTKNNTTGYYEGTIAFSTVVSANTSSIYAVGYTIGSRSNSYASSVGSNKSIWSWTGVGAPSNVSVTYLAASNKFRVTGNAGSSGVNNDVTSVLWCWEIEGVSSERSCPYTWHGRYTTATEDHNRGTISCSAGASFSFDIPLANKNTTYYTFVIYTQGTYDNNYGGDYEGIHVIRNSYTGNSIEGLSTHTVHNISYGYTAAITDFSCWRVNELYRNVYDYYVTAGTSTVGINICGVQYNIKYFADEERSDLITREYYSDSCSAGEYIGGRLNYPTVPVNHIYLTIELYTLYDNTGKPSQIGPMTTYEMEMIRYTPCTSPKLIFPNPETSIEKFIPFTGTSCTIPITFGNAENGDNNPITSFKVELVNYDADVIIDTIPVELGDLLPATQRTITLSLTNAHTVIGNGRPLLIRVLAYSDEWGETWFPTDSPMLDNGEYANQVILYIYETGYVYQKVGTQQQQGFAYTKVNGSWKLATPDIFSKVSGSWKGTPDTSIPTNVYDK